MARRFAYWIAGMAVWMLLTWSVQYQSLIAGAVLSFISALIFGNYLPLEKVGRLLNPRRWLWFILYLVVFAYQCFKANLDVAMRVLSPGINLKPGIVRIKTTLRTDIARVFLANSITLTPGTMTVDIQDDVLYIHWIDVATDDPQEIARKIKGPFERYLAKVFD